VPLLLLGAALDQGPGQDLGPGDQRPAHAQRAAGQLLGGHDHAQVVTLAAGGEAPVLLGDRQAEGAQLGQARDDVLGDVAVVAVDVLGDRADLVLGEAPERVLHELEVVVEVAGAGALDRGQELRGPVGRHERAGGVERVRRDAPVGLAPVELGRHVGHGVGGEGAGDRRLLVALGAVVEQRTGGLDRGGRVGEVVGHDLVVVDRSCGGEVCQALMDDLAGELDGGRSGVQIGRGHTR
jgi:hypothetical protein